MRYPRGSADDSLPEARQPIRLGKAELLRSGEDLALLAYGSMVATAWHAADALDEEGVRCTVVN
ncbi:MAG: 1-deoxy-D-xylulose-5-phosphate synthase, partial [Armatimonadota bacterium]